MTDDEIAVLLGSDAPLVVIEAPAGCGKTYQAAKYAADAAESISVGRVLVMTVHTHAACSVIADRIREYRTKIDIRTLDSLINEVATAYRVSLDLPVDVAAWARSSGYVKLAILVATLLRDKADESADTSHCCSL